MSYYVPETPQAKLLTREEIGHILERGATGIERDLIGHIYGLMQAMNDMGIQIALSYQEQANLEIADWSIEHLKVVLTAIDARLKFVAAQTQWYAPPEKLPTS